MSTDGLLPAAWRIKMVEKIHRSTRDQREKWIQNANYNLFNLRSYQVFIDLLTDSGTGSMSDHQWAALLTGDETYAGSSSFTRLHDKVKTLFGFDNVLPVHQGRAAEHALFAVLVKEGDVVPGNSHFDTTRAHIEYRKAKAVDCPMDDAFCVKSCDKFKGNVNIKKLRSVLDTNRGRVPLILVTITCNKSGGQPVSIDNMRQIKDLANRDRIPVIFDSARFAENAWFIQKREPGYHNKSIQEIVREMYKYADGMMMSGKKDGLVNIGGILAMRSTEWFKKASDYVVLFEGFTQYGGLAGRDMDALAVGLSEVTDLDYLDSRIGQVRRFGETLLDADIPVQQPIGGHCIAIDACAFLPLVPRGEYVAQTLAVDLYLEAGVRGVEIGTILDGRDPSTGKNRHPQAEFMRLAIPRRVYMNEHLDLVANALIRIYRRRNAITRGFRISEEAKTLRHFTIRLERVLDGKIENSTERIEGRNICSPEDNSNTQDTIGDENDWDLCRITAQASGKRKTVP